MSIEGAIDVAFRKEYERAPDPQKRRQEMIDETRARIMVTYTSGKAG